MKLDKINIEQQIAELKTKTSDELVELWHKYFDHKPRQYQRSFMIRRIAYEMQARVYGRLPKTIINKLERLAYQKQDKLLKKKLVNPGTKIMRDWNGHKYEVNCLEDGSFEFNNKKYRSLSVIAKEITGSHWSGPLFFGLRKQVVKNG